MTSLADASATRLHCRHHRRGAKGRKALAIPRVSPPRLRHAHNISAKSPGAGSARAVSESDARGRHRSEEPMGPSLLRRRKREAKAGEGRSGCATHALPHLFARRCAQAKAQSQRRPHMHVIADLPHRHITCASTLPAQYTHQHHTTTQEEATDRSTGDMRTVRPLRHNDHMQRPTLRVRAGDLARPTRRSNATTP